MADIKRSKTSFVVRQGGRRRVVHEGDLVRGDDPICRLAADRFEDVEDYVNRVSPRPMPEPEQRRRKKPGPKPKTEAKTDEAPKDEPEKVDL